ncbi:gamma-glutamylcyclotransferase [Pelagibius litoralis]|uniref:glutathione-specific gamma-glutamylcyclotransferase n=2 Tax=Pelagibius litoralis TaxID=374515 RepID=A0A967C851_9PROT|nr:gamma-glutamylcyclotransferase [Pelagibius litoralis]
MAARRLSLPPRQDFWVFGYGSLMWHPGFPHVEVRIARLNGLHRRFCVFSHRYRGTPRLPGLVLGLDRGGSCRGLAFRVPAAEGEAVLDYLYEREMITGVYLPSWRAAKTDQGVVPAITFVVDRAHPQYAGGLPHDRIVEMILQGRGDRGPCVEYLENTVHHLQALGLRDRALERLLSEARVRRG